MSEERQEQAEERVSDIRRAEGFPTETHRPGVPIPQAVRDAVGVKCASIGASGTDDQDWQDK